MTPVRRRRPRPACDGPRARRARPRARSARPWESGRPNSRAHETPAHPARSLWGGLETHFLRVRSESVGHKTGLAIRRRGKEPMYIGVGNSSVDPGIRPADRVRLLATRRAHMCARERTSAGGGAPLRSTTLGGTALRALVLRHRRAGCCAYAARRVRCDPGPQRVVPHAGVDAGLAGRAQPSPKLVAPTTQRAAGVRPNIGPPESPWQVSAPPCG